MQALNELVTTLEVVRDAVTDKDRDKGFEAVTVFLMQFQGVFGHSIEFMGQMFPLLEDLKNHIQSESFDQAEPLVLALLAKFRQAREEAS
jgi:hypothetical protein